MQPTKTTTVERPWPADNWAVCAIVCHALISLALGETQGRLGEACLLALTGALPGGMGWAFRKNKRYAPWLMTVSLAIFSGIQMHLAPMWPVGALGALLSISLLTNYQDWRLPTTLALLAIGAGVLMGADAPGQPSRWVFFAFIGIHAAYHARQAYRDNIQEGERFELEFLIRAMGYDGPIRLSLGVLKTESVAGNRLKHVIERVRVALTHMRQAAGGVQSASDILTRGSADLNTRTHSTANGLRDAAMCLEQINVIVQSSAQASMEAKTMAANASDLANRGGELVGEVVSTMQDIDQSAQRITDIIGVIDNIAFQTNILALNAAVEAARAGEQGRGFAVVAAEVRSLALRSSQAAKEIKELIGVSLNTIESGREVVAKAGATMQDIVLSVKRVGEVFEQLSADSNEHAGGIDAVTQSVKELDIITQQNLVLAQETSDLSVQLATHAQAFDDILHSFQLGGDAVLMPKSPTKPPIQPSLPSASSSLAPMKAVRANTPEEKAATGIEFF